MALTVAKIRKAEPRDKDYKLYHEKGLFLLVKKNGAKYWRFKYRHGGKEKLMALGVYPEVSVREAEKESMQARLKLRQGNDPMAERAAKGLATKQDASNSFEAVALEWLKIRGVKSESGDKRLRSLLERDLFPYLGSKPIADITSPMLLDVLRKIESRGAIETAHRAKQYCGQIFRYAIVTSRRETDPSIDLKGALSTPKEKHFAAILDPKKLGELLVAIENYQGSPEVKAALKLTPMLFCRPTELRALEWEEIDFESAQINIPAHRTKTKEPLVIPLSKQAQSILQNLQPITGRGKYVFPGVSNRSKPLSENGVRTALRTMGYGNDVVTPHGFRATAKTIMTENPAFRDVKAEWVEKQLGHKVKDVNGQAYNRAKFIEQRTEMMQRWSDFLQKAKENAH